MAEVKTEVKIAISADGKQAIQVSEDISAAYKKLGVQSIAEIQKARSEITAAYEKIRNSGVVSQEEIKQAWAAKNKKIGELDNQLIGSTQGMTARLKACWVEYAAAAGIAIGLAVKASEYMQIGAKALQAQQSFEAVADAYNVSASKIIENMRRVTKATIDESALQQKAVKALAADIPAEYLEGLSKAAVVGGRIMGTSVEQSFEDVIDAISSNMPRSLKRMTLLTKEEMAAINKAFSAGFEEIANTAMTQFVIKNAEEKFKKLKAEVDSAAENMQRFNAAWKELTETMGKVEIAVFPKVWDFFKMLGIGVAGTAEAVLSIAAGMIKIQETVTGTGQGVADWFSGQAAQMSFYRKSLTANINKDLGIKDYKRPEASTLPNLAGVGIDLPYGLRQGALEQIKKIEEEKAKEKNKVWTAEELKRLAASKANLEAELQAEQTEFSKSIATAKDFYANRLDIEKKNLEENIAEIDYAQKTGALSIQEAEDLKQQYLKDSYQKQEQISRTGQVAIANIIDTEGEKIGGIYRSLFGISKEEDKPAIISKEKAFLAEVSALRISSESETDRQIFDLQSEGRMKTTAAELAFREADKNEFTKAIQSELEITQAGINAREELQTSAIGREKEKLEWLHQHNLISDQDYYARSKNLIKDDLDVRNQALDDQTVALYDARVKEIYYEGTTKERIQEILRELTKAYEEYYDNKNKLASQAAGEIKKIDIEESKTFENGMQSGIKGYIKSLEYGYEKGKKLTEETAGALMSSFQTMFFDNFKNGLDSLYTYFKNTLSKMVTEALMEPIVVKISTAFTSTLKDLKDALSDGGSSLLKLLGAGGTGYGIGSSLSGSKEAGYGGAAGGLGGYILGSMFNLEIAGAIGNLLGKEIGFALTLAIPGIGAILGAVLGSLLGGLFKKKAKVPKLGLAYSETGDFPDLKYGGTYTYEDYYGFATGGGSGDNVTESEKKSVLKSFRQYRDDLKKVFSDLNLDVSGFAKTWSETFDAAGLSSDELQTKMKNMFADYASFATGVDFSKFQKSGEELSDTVDRIVGAMAQIAAVIKQAWDETLQTGWDIQKMYDSIDIHGNTYKEALDKIDSKITDAVSALGSLTGEDWGSKITKIGELLADRYDKEVAYLTYIKGLQESIADDIQKVMDNIDLSGMTGGEKLTHYFNKALEDYNAIMAETDPKKLEDLSKSLLDSTGAFVSILLSLKDRIKSLADTIKQNLVTMQKAGMDSYEIAKYYWDKSQTLASAYVNATDIEDKIKYGELLTGSINDLFNSLQTLQGAFDNLKESADKTLRSMRMSMMSPTQKVDYINTEITDAYAKYKEAKASDEYGKMTYWGQKITELANEGWALGIDQQASFANIEPLLKEISADMASASQATTDVIKDILVPALEYLQNEMLSLSDNIDAALSAVKDVLTTLNTTIQDELVAAINAEITALTSLSDTLNSIDWSALGSGGSGGSGSSGSSGSSAYSFTMSDAGYFALYNSSSGALKYDVTEPNYTGPAYSGYTKLSGSAIEFYDSLNNLIGSLSWYKIGDVQYVGGYPLTPHASGLDYVPYDNYGALLHKGEAVVTARGNEALGRALDRLERIEQRLNSNSKDGQVIVLNINGDLDRILDITAEELEGRVIKAVRRNPAVLTGR